MGSQSSGADKNYFENYQNNTKFNTQAQLLLANILKKNTSIYYGK